MRRTFRTGSAIRAEINGKIKSRFENRKTVQLLLFQLD